MIRRLLFAFFIIGSSSWSKAMAAAVKGQISSQNETVHLEFTGRESWDYDLKKISQNKKAIVQLTLESLDEITAQQLRTFKNPFIKSVKVEPGTDKKSLLSFELINDSVESFDYLTDQPSRLIVDFFMSSKSVGETVKKVSKIQEKPASEIRDKAKSRKPATTDALQIQDAGPIEASSPTKGEIRSGIFDGGDPNFERFSIKDYEIREEAILKSKDNFYIPFPMLELENVNWNRVKSAVPEYSIKPNDSAENKQARLLLTLFKKGRFQVYLKTHEWFQDKFPQSEYSEIISFMTADVYYKLWQNSNRPVDFDMAIEKYKESVRKYPKSTLGERISLMVGYLQLDRGDLLSAIKNLNEHIGNDGLGGPHIFSKDLARLGVYLSYLKLNKYNEAFETLNVIEKNSQHADLKIEAAYRKGDIFVKSKNFARAVEEYQRALKLYPQGQSYLPNAFYNQGESLFLMDKHRQSLDTFREFAKRFPSDEHTPFALTRLGELLEILGADKSRVMGAYLETYFRYGESPSAIVARLRLLSAKMRGMKSKEVDSTVKEILSLSQKLDLPQIQQFATIMIADGYNQRGDYKKALDLLVNYYQQNTSSVDESQIRNRIVSNINDDMRERIENGKFIEGLKLHQKYADNWLKGADRLDTSYFVGRAFELGGAYNQAEKHYKEVLNSYYAALNTPRQKRLSVLEHLPSIDSLNLRLGKVTLEQGFYNRAYDHLKSIKNPEKMPEEEQIERVSMAVKLLDKRGDSDSAIRYLTELLKTWQGVPALLGEPYFQLAELEIKTGKRADAKKSLEKVDQLMKDSEGGLPEGLHAEALEKLANLYSEDKEIEKSIASYKGLLEQYEEKRPLSSVRYKLGRIYFDRGEIQKAAEAWDQFKNDKTGLWKDIAQEELKGVQWRSDYKKYIKRIPAMAGKVK